MSVNIGRGCHSTSGTSAMVGMAELVRKGHKYFVPDFGTDLILRRNRDFRDGIIRLSWREGLAGTVAFQSQYLLFSFGAVLYKRTIVALSSTVLCGRHRANLWDRKKGQNIRWYSSFIFCPTKWDRIESTVIISLHNSAGPREWPRRICLLPSHHPALT